MSNATAAMKRGATERETCELNGWGVGTVLRGHEEWANGKGVWTTIRLTALGDSRLLARCVEHEHTEDGRIVDRKPCNHGEGTWTLGCRDWVEADQ